MTKSLKKTWLITGISSGFGKLLATELMNRGDFVIGTFRSQDQTDKFNQQHADSGFAYTVDVAFPEQIDALYTEIYKRFDAIDVLVNNAGYGILGAIEEMSLEEARKQMEVNFFGALYMTQKILPVMRRQKSGHIVQMSSMAGFSSAPACGMYNASKFALEGFSEALAMEVALFNIKVIIVEPGPFRTNFCGAPLQSTAKKIHDYEPAIGPILAQLHHQHGKQEGDPQKAVEVIIKAVYANNAPLRLPLGKIAYDSMLSKMESVKQDLESWHTVTCATSFHNEYQGECSCGKIKFSCDGDPLFTQHCHCHKCRKVASLSAREIDKKGYGFTAAYLTSHFKILENENALYEILGNHSKLLLCKHCHSLIYGISLDPDKQAGIGINANNIDFSGGVPVAFNAVRHIWYADRIVDVEDDLPKFKDAPKEQFGTGELL